MIEQTQPNTRNRSKQDVDEPKRRGNYRLNDKARRHQTPQMIKRNSLEWETFIRKLNDIKKKSNREVLCIKCWQMLNCK